MSFPRTRSDRRTGVGGEVTKARQTNGRLTFTEGKKRFMAFFTTRSSQEGRKEKKGWGHSYMMSTKYLLFYTSPPMPICHLFAIQRKKLEWISIFRVCLYVCSCVNDSAEPLDGSAELAWWHSRRNKLTLMRPITLFRFLSFASTCYRQFMTPLLLSADVISERPQRQLEEDRFMRFILAGTERGGVAGEP